MNETLKELMEDKSYLDPRQIAKMYQLKLLHPFDAIMLYFVSVLRRGYMLNSRVKLIADKLGIPIRTAERK